MDNKNQDNLEKNEDSVTEGGMQKIDANNSIMSQVAGGVMMETGIHNIDGMDIDEDKTYVCTFRGGNSPKHHGCVFFQKQCKNYLIKGKDIIKNGGLSKFEGHEISDMGQSDYPSYIPFNFGP